jgi:three-Cys-motif partner protein
MPNVDLKHYIGREQAYVKHCLLEKYLAPLVYKVGSAWDSIVYIEGFSGPWKVNDPDLRDSSFGVALETLRAAHVGLYETRGRKVPIEMILVEANKQAFEILEWYAKKKTMPGFSVHPLFGEFAYEIPNIQHLVSVNCRNPFRFVFLDPKGWADIPMKEMETFLRDRSCEVLINLMTRHIVRFLDEESRAESYNNLFGRIGVLEKLRGFPKENNERAEQAVREYCRSLRKLCGYTYVSSAVILEPLEESVRYYLVYGTNSIEGLKVFKKAEMNAAEIQDRVRKETRIRNSRQEEFFFGPDSPKSKMAQTLRSRYLRRAREKVLKVLKQNTNSRGVSYRDLFREAMAFPLITPGDLEDWMDELSSAIEKKFASSDKRRRKLSPDADDRIVVINRGAFADDDSEIC